MVTVEDGYSVSLNREVTTVTETCSVSFPFFINLCVPLFLRHDSCKQYVGFYKKLSQTIFVY